MDNFFYTNETLTISQRFKVRIHRYAWTLLNIKDRGLTWKSRYLWAKKKIAKNKPPFTTLGLVHKLYRAKLCAEYIFSGSLCTAWVYKIVQCLAVPAPVANSRKITTGPPVFSVILETRLQTNAMVQFYLIFKSFKHLLKFSRTLCQKLCFQIQGL